MDGLYQKNRISGIEKLNGRHYKILDLRIEGLGIQQIADHLGMHRNQVSIIVNSPTFEHEFALRRARKEETMDSESTAAVDEVQRALQEGALLAAEKLVKTIKSPGASDRDAGHAAEAILDRTGYPKTQRQEGGGGQQIVVIGADKLEKLTEALEMDGRRN